MIAFQFQMLEERRVNERSLYKIASLVKGKSIKIHSAVVNVISFDGAFIISRELETLKDLPTSLKSDFKISLKKYITEK